jgi:hypothetical protein
VLRDDLLGAVLDGRTPIELTIYDAYFEVWCPDRAETYQRLRPGAVAGDAPNETGTTTTSTATSTSGRPAGTTTTERAP